MSTSRSSQVRRTAGGRRPASSVAMVLARRSATAISGSLASMVTRSLIGSLIAQFYAAAKAGHAIDGDDHREGDQQHGDAEHRDGTEVAGFLEIEDEHRDHLGFRGE